VDWVAQTLRQYPELAILAALGIGLGVGPLKLGKFSLGNVTAVLLAGVLIGQLDIAISPSVKSVFFLMFLFATGYDVGPQFVRGLKRDGLPQVLFACVLCVAVLLSTYVAASLAGYHAGLAAGLLSGAATSSGVLGVATDTINGLGLPSDRAKAWTDAMPVAYAVTYLFGTAGSAWFLAFIGPGCSASISSGSARTTSEGWADRSPRRVGSAPTPRWRSARTRSRRIRSSWASASRTSRRASRSPGSPPSSTPSGGTAIS
jgi:putative transport protein